MTRQNSRTDILLRYRRQADKYPGMGSDRKIVSDDKRAIHSQTTCSVQIADIVAGQLWITTKD